MTDILQVGNRTLAATELLSIMRRYQLLPQLFRELVIDQAIASISLPPDVQDSALEQFFAHHHLTTPEHRQRWLTHTGLTPADVTALAQRHLQLETFKQQTWGSKLEAEFLRRKSQLDQVIYSILRTQSPEIAHELYFRIQSGEQTFAELAQAYSQGSEAQTGGLIGPIALGNLHPTLAQLLQLKQPGRLCPPTPIGEWLVIVRLEKQLSVSLDAPMRQQILNQLFAEWLQTQVSQLSVSFPSPSALAPIAS
jgi:parvulin-like peptidyl-prolyl isomerase